MRMWLEDCGRWYPLHCFHRLLPNRLLARTSSFSCSDPGLGFVQMQAFLRGGIAAMAWREAVASRSRG